MVPWVWFSGGHSAVLLRLGEHTPIVQQLYDDTNVRTAATAALVTLSFGNNSEGQHIFELLFASVTAGHMLVF